MNKLVPAIAATVLCMAATSFAPQAQADCDDDEPHYSAAERLIGDTAGRQLHRARKVWSGVKRRCGDGICIPLVAEEQDAVSVAPAEEPSTARKSASKRTGRGTAPSAPELKTANPQAAPAKPDVSMATECKRYFPGVGRMLAVPCGE